MAKSINSLVITAALSLVVTAPFAGEVASGSVSRLQVGSDGIGVFTVTGTYTSRPACNSSSTFTVNVTTAAGNAILETMQAAVNGNAQVRIVGTGTCAGSSESILTVAQLSPVANSTGEYAVCINGSPGQNGNCACNPGKDIIPKQIAYSSCRVSTSTGQTCSAGSATTYFNTNPTYWYGSCCLCAR